MIDIKTTGLFNKLSQNGELTKAIIDIRENCILLGETIKTLIPGFTDHSVKHMDSLWGIADSVFTKDEIESFSVSEAFVLGASFYFHDLGMAMACTKEGISYLKLNEKYISIYNRNIELYKLPPQDSEIIALRLASRNLHSENAIKLCKDQVPGLNKFIIEKQTIRENWANYIGEVSASHHWSLTVLDQKLGIRGIVPSPINDNIDLGFIACALRVIDYAHINSERANYIEKILRFDIDDDSLLHWKAQENINGPLRTENKLKYVSYKPIEDIEAWWLYYDMCLGLDREIVSVSEYLDTKTETKNRFSLEGVQNVKTPKNFATLVRTLNFEPIDIRFKPDSIERLVDILGGKTLYGNDTYAPLRELIQNSRDAILLRKRIESDSGNTDYYGKIKITLDNTTTPPKLTISDNGLGMTSNIIENYLLGIASNYWESEDFYSEFPNAKKQGFSPTGKFGIGFLSVFMIGDFIEVETERKAKQKLKLLLKGLGKHGSLVASSSTGNFGTSIKVSISKQDSSIYNNLEMIVKARAPMLSFPIEITTPSQSGTIESFWWKKASQKELFDFALKWEGSAHEGNARIRLSEEERYFYRRGFNEQTEFSKVDRYKKWPEKQPEIVDENYRLLAIPDFGKVILCSRGIAVKSITLRGLTGLIDIDNIELTASRDQTIKWDYDSFIKDVIQKIRPSIIDSLNKLRKEGMITSRFEFIKKVADTYGTEILIESTIPWITILVPPGDAKLFSYDESIQYIQNKDEILISYGTGPWSTEEACRSYFPSATDEAVIVPINDINQPSFGSFSSHGETVFDTLPKQFSRDDEDFNRYKSALFLTTFLIVLSKSWNIKYEQLINAHWLTKSDKHLCAYFKKSDFI